MKILGVYGGVTLGQHDPAAAIVCDGKLIAVCEEERFIRVNHRLLLWFRSGNVFVLRRLRRPSKCGARYCQPQQRYQGFETRPLENSLECSIPR